MPARPERTEPQPPRLAEEEGIWLAPERLVLHRIERVRLGILMVLVALLLHGGLVALLLVDWHGVALPEVRPIKVTLVQEPPPPPPEPPPPPPWPLRSGSSSPMSPGSSST